MKEKENYKFAEIFFNGHWVDVRSHFDDAIELIMQSLDESVSITIYLPITIVLC